MNRKFKILTSVVIILLILVLSIPIVKGDIKPAPNPKDKLFVFGIAEDIMNFNNFEGYKGINYIKNNTDIRITHHTNNLLVQSIDYEYKDITIKIFRANTNVIDIKNFTGYVYRSGLFLMMIGTHSNFKIYTW